MANVISNAAREQINKCTEIVFVSGWKAGEPLIDEFARSNPSFRKWAKILGIVLQTNEVFSNRDVCRIVRTSEEVVAIVEYYEVAKSNGWQVANQITKDYSRKNPYFPLITAFVMAMIAREEF